MCGRTNPSARSFSRVARSTIVPILEEIKDVMVGKVESASIFHRSTARGLADQGLTAGRTTSARSRSSGTKRPKR